MNIINIYFLLIRKVAGLMRKNLTALLLVILMLVSVAGCSTTKAVSALPPSVKSISGLTANNTESQPTAKKPAESLTNSSEKLPEDPSFEIRFLDVGQADAALIKCDDKAMLIDGGNSKDSNLIYSVLKAQKITHLDYIIATHAHEDHVGGLAGALNAAAAGTVYSPVDSYDSKAFKNFLKYVRKQGLELTYPPVGKEISLGSATVQFIGPQKDYEDPNNTSIVVRIVYGETSFLFTGDAETEAEHDIIDAGYDLSSTVLKVGHHGSEASTSYVFLREVMPEYAVISVGKDNPYGHPHDNTLSRLRDAGVIVYRTDMQGDIICTSDGKTVSFTTERNANVQTNPTMTDDSEENTVIYIGNKNTLKFHLPSCKSLPLDKNRVYFDSREDALEQGYDPCKNCKP